jgi:hypothetical protein
LFSKPQSEIELGIDDNGDNNHRPTQFRNQLLILNRLSTNRIQNEEFGLFRPDMAKVQPSRLFFAALELKENNSPLKKI